jgi:hypothetical protein
MPYSYSFTLHFAIIFLSFSFTFFGFFSYPFSYTKKASINIHVLDLVSQVRDIVLMNVYLGLGYSGGSGFWNGGYMNKGREMGRSVYEQPGNEMDGSCHSKEGSK